MTPTMVFALRQELLALDGEERKQRLRHDIRQVLAKVAGLRAADLDVDRPLLSLGLDSLTLLDMLAAFHEKLQVPIALDKLPPEASLDQLAGMMAALLEQPAVDQDEHPVRQAELFAPPDNADLGSLTGLLYKSSWQLQSLPGPEISNESIPLATVLPLATLVQTVTAAVDHLISPEQQERYQELERGSTDSALCTLRRAVAPRGRPVSGRPVHDRRSGGIASRRPPSSASLRASSEDAERGRRTSVRRRWLAARSVATGR